MTPEELLKCKEKLRISKERLAETEAAYEEIQKKIGPLQEQMEKLKKDADYHRSRVVKYQKMMESFGGQNG